ncbi:hypothetical protein [Vibrio sp. WXL210]|uniref:hypothetical protein n=1 Tax=Vibrio sp. WXL210 TaxID=3450709 RepID=UPI003EC94256
MNLNKTQIEVMRKIWTANNDTVYLSGKRECEQGRKLILHLCSPAMGWEIERTYSNNRDWENTYQIHKVGNTIKPLPTLKRK